MFCRAKKAGNKQLWSYNKLHIHRTWTTICALNDYTKWILVLYKFRNGCAFDDTLPRLPVRFSFAIYCYLAHVKLYIFFAFVQVTYSCTVYSYLYDVWCALARHCYVFAVSMLIQTNLKSHVDPLCLVVICLVYHMELHFLFKQWACRGIEHLWSKLQYNRIFLLNHDLHVQTLISKAWDRIFVIG